uniref:Gnk2-homologous domain-containing protein n=1 Tax=Arundo donax TaxID=35708 RepID=A0A0A8YK66_ARUDO
MSREHCQDCLYGIITNRKQMVSSGQMGSAILGSRCSLWYQTDIQFFTGNPTLSLNMPTCKFISNAVLVDLVSNSLSSSPPLKHLVKTK